MELRISKLECWRYLNEKETPICKNRHPIHEDGFEYLDCMLFHKNKDVMKRESLVKVMMDRVFSFNQIY